MRFNIPPEQQCDEVDEYYLWPKNYGNRKVDDSYIRFWVDFKGRLNEKWMKNAENIAEATLLERMIQYDAFGNERQ